MEGRNGSAGSAFLLLGLSDDPRAQICLFVLFFTIYCTTVIGNSFLIIVWYQEPRLHTPMYFFLVNLAVVDFCLSSAVVPNMLFQLLITRTISFSRCAVQMYISLTAGISESVLLAVMAYDRYIAISYPLRYFLIMTRHVCSTLAACCWIGSCLVSLLNTVIILHLPLCGANIVNNVFCEAITFVSMTCIDPFTTELLIFCCGVFVLLLPTAFTLISYARIVFTIAQIRSSEAKSKAFSTCSSHFIVVALFYGTAIFMYMKPVPRSLEDHNKIIALFYTVTPPMVNPLIYSLRNNDVKRALQKLVNQHSLHLEL